MKLKYLYKMKITEEEVRVNWINEKKENLKILLLPLGCRFHVKCSFGATTLIITTFNITPFRISNTQNKWHSAWQRSAIMLNVRMLRVIFYFYHYAAHHYAQCHYVYSHGAIYFCSNINFLKCFWFSYLNSYENYYLEDEKRIKSAFLFF